MVTNPKAKRRNELLIAARGERAWTQQQTADKCNVQLLTYQRWEYRLCKPQSAQLSRVCRVFGKSAAELGLDDPPENDIDQSQQVVVPAKDYTMSDFLKASLDENLTSRLTRIVTDWSRQVKHPGDLKELQNGINATIEGYKGRSISRRAALENLVLLPLQACALSKGPQPISTILIQCTAGVAAAGHVGRGQEMQLAFDALSTYIPTLERIAQVSLQHRAVTLSLLAQCYIFKGEMARHLESNTHSVIYLDQAEICAKEAGDALMQILAPRKRATTHSHASHKFQAALDAKKASAVLQENKRTIPKHIHSYVHASIAFIEAGVGNFDEARQVLKIAQDTYTEDAPLGWVGYNQADLLASAGRTLFRIGEHKSAADTMQKLVEDITIFHTANIQNLLFRA